jgi:hypothetical protein
MPAGPVFDSTQSYIAFAAVKFIGYTAATLGCLLLPQRKPIPRIVFEQRLVPVKLFGRLFGKFDAFGL